MIPRKMIVTSSLPYANGDIHLGHLLEVIQTDIFVRFQRMRGHHCHYICGSDAHGTPIMLRAEKDNISPAELVKQTRETQLQDFNDFHISFDCFHTTHSTENQHFTEMVYARLQTKGDILTKTIQQAYDPIKKMFLPDRFIKGGCPTCQAPDQYGDSCEQCGATYDPLEMQDPISVLSGQPPIQKESEHFFFNLAEYADFLKDWLHAGHVQKPIANKLDEWFQEGLKAWDISRDAPYFGFKIPGTDDKYFYVWLDAPIGYIASFAKFCHENPQIDFDEYWDINTDTELYHFVGKDVVYFHSLFWPAVLKSADLRLPTAIYTHGFLTIEGQKMSKSRGTFINGRTYLNHLNPEYLRYYFASKLSASIEDLDLNFDDFKQKVNSDLVGKLINIASRCSGFITKNFAGQLSPHLPSSDLFNTLAVAGNEIAEYYETRQFSAAIREIMRLADLANQYVNDQAPWNKFKNPNTQAEVQEICTLALNLFRQLIIYLQPVMPLLAEKTAQFLNVAPFIWHDSTMPLLDHKIETYQPLMTRIEETQMTALKTETGLGTDVEKPVETAPAKKDYISIDDFLKIDLRIAKIIHAEHVAEADKLLRLELDLGEATHRQVFAGIKSAYSPEQLIGKQVVCVANLEPRKMRFGLSEGMILACSDDNQLLVITPDGEGKPGMKVK